MESAHAYSQHAYNLFGRAQTCESQAHHEMGPQKSNEQKKITVLPLFLTQSHGDIFCQTLKIKGNGRREPVQFRFVLKFVWTGDFSLFFLIFPYFLIVGGFVVCHP